MKRLEKKDRNCEFIEAIRAPLNLYNITNVDYKNQGKKNIIQNFLALVNKVIKKCEHFRKKIAITNKYLTNVLPAKEKNFAFLLKLFFGKFIVYYSMPKIYVIVY